MCDYLRIVISTPTQSLEHQTKYFAQIQLQNNAFFITIIPTGFKKKMEKFSLNDIKKEDLLFY